MRSLKNFSSN